MGDNREKPEYLEFSCQEIVLSVEPGELIEDSFTIHAADKYAEGKYTHLIQGCEHMRQNFAVRRHKSHITLMELLLRQEEAFGENL